MTAPSPAGTPGVVPTEAVIKVRTKDGSSYTGLTAAKINGNTFLYAANFTKGRVDVWDNAFNKVALTITGKTTFSQHGPFTDDFLPPNFVPFNVQTIGNDIVVTFVLHEGGPFETDGPGLGYVDIFSSGGKLLRRLDHGPWLNAPWGVALAPLDFGVFSHALLIGQFAGSETTGFGGTIAAYDLATGAFLGNVRDSANNILSIPGIWAISPANSASANSYDTIAASPAGALYFTAGPDHGSGGLFGYLEPVATQPPKATTSNSNRRPKEFAALPLTHPRSLGSPVQRDLGFFHFPRRRQPDTPSLIGQNVRQNRLGGALRKVHLAQHIE